MDDSALVDLFMARDEQALRLTADKYGRRLRSLSRGITGDAATAEECENDTYWEAWNRIPPHEPRTYLYPFLAAILRHISLNRCRSRQKLAARLSKEGYTL